MHVHHYFIDRIAACVTRLTIGLFYNFFIDRRGLAEFRVATHTLSTDTFSRKKKNFSSPTKKLSLIKDLPLGLKPNGSRAEPSLPAEHSTEFSDWHRDSAANGAHCPGAMWQSQTQKEKKRTRLQCDPQDGCAFGESRGSPSPSRS